MENNMVKIVFLLRLSELILNNELRFQWNVVLLLNKKVYC